ncbi:D-threo-aldose 1-dehydrogenase [Mycobacterium talmoniae]|uniref:D-threo-aldose 1-dehydrogenase n=1 Tax=Mycobacterium talmoniae TaxID=1858794 RepID=A0A2S8BSW0_9MYCO|nr:D-threo-aldose 1-dehydrogenase [Mycobacterium talmoniae]
MRTTTLGTLTTSVIGLGCMGMSAAYGAADRAESIATVHAALDAGIRLVDTGDFYGMGHNELLLAEALRPRPRDSYQLSVKFGGQLGPDGSWVATTPPGGVSAGWGTDPVEMGMGGSIPFIAEFAAAYPAATILVTGVEDPATQAHSVNESLHLGVLERAAISEALLLGSLV